MMTFAELFGRAATVHADAPGRVNLIGEHTDYNGGFVLPTSIPQRTRVALAPRDDDRVRAASASLGATLQEYRLGHEHKGGTWLDYVQGCTSVLIQDGHRLRGFDVHVASDVPLGSGLSSSAAFDVALLRALRTAFALSFDDLHLARLGQQVENQFVGAQVGIMDPLACALGEAGAALFIDTRSLHYERVPLPAGAEMVVINSGVAHDHAAGDYNSRRAECEQACRLLGVPQLRDLELSDLARVEGLPEPLNRRARHVVTEDARVHEAVAALRQGDWPRLGRLFYDSHASMREDYQVSVQEIDLLIELARRQESVYGARLTGGGFGGSVVLMTRAGTGAAVARSVAEEYARQTGRTPTVLVPALVPSPLAGEG
jgi:galactokinase